MPTFIDESGETGKMSPYFRLAAVWVPTLRDVETFRSEMRRFQASIGLTGYEFKSSKSVSIERRREYFQTALSCPFQFAVTSIDKSSEQWSEAKGSDIHWASVVSLAAALKPAYLEEERRRFELSGKVRALNELIIIDDNEDQKFLSLVKDKFRELKSEIKAGASLAGKTKFRGSGPEELIQLVDMVCGETGRHLDSEETCFDLIAERSLGVYSHIL